MFALVPGPFLASGLFDFAKMGMFLLLGLLFCASVWPLRGWLVDSTVLVLLAASCLSLAAPGLALCDLSPISSVWPLLGWLSSPAGSSEAGSPFLLACASLAALGPALCHSGSIVFPYFQFGLLLHALLLAAPRQARWC